MRSKKPALPKPSDASDDPAGLRRRAEVRLGKRRNDRLAGTATPRMAHELEVHQVELEMQNAELHRARNELETALEKYTDLYDFAPVGYLSVDDAGVILEANLTGASLLGVARSRLINRRLPSFVPAAGRTDFIAFLERTVAGSKEEAYEAQVLKEGAGALWAGFRARPGNTLEGNRRWCRIAFHDITVRKQVETAQRKLDVVSAANREMKREIARRRKVENALRKSEREQALLLEQSRHMHAKLRDMTHRVLSAQEEERRRISRELHDEIAQMLVGINFRLSTLTKDAAAFPRGFQKELTRTRRLVEHSVEAVQRFARDLRPKMLDDLGLVPALRTFLTAFAKQTGVRCRLTATPGMEQLDLAKRTALYRVAQEALTNVARHAQASQVEVILRKRPDRICMTIADDGKSFQPERLVRSARTKRLGLLGMRERLNMVGGRFDVASAPGKGTTVTAHVPLGKAALRSDG